MTKREKENILKVIDMHLEQLFQGKAKAELLRVVFTAISHLNLMLVRKPQITRAKAIKNEN